MMMNNKARRQELTKLKHKKRCNVLGLKPEEHYCYKEQAKPCSCILCSPNKYSRKVKHRKDEYDDED